MKNIIKLTMLALLIQLAACKDDEPSPRAAKVNQLTASTWGNAQVMHATDGDLSSQYSDFAIMFTNRSANGYEGTYIVTNGGHAFTEGTGKWRFNNELNKIILDPGRELEIQLEDQHLKLGLTVPMNLGGRTDGLNGYFVFNLTPL